MAYKLHKHLAPVCYTCWECSSYQGQISFSSRQSFRSHLCWIHHADIDERKSISGEWEQVIVKLTDQQLAARKRKFQLRAASPAERRALYKIEQKRKTSNSFPCQVPNLLIKEKDEEEEIEADRSLVGSEMNKEQAVDRSLVVLVQEGDEQKKRQVLDEWNNDGAEEKNKSQAEVNWKKENNNTSSLKLNEGTMNVPENDWFEEAELASLLPELSNNVGLQDNESKKYRAPTPEDELAAVQTITVTAEVAAVGDHSEMMDISHIPPPQMFADNNPDAPVDDRGPEADRREEDRSDETDRREVNCTNTNIRSSVMSNVDLKCARIKHNFVIPSFEQQYDALFQQISAETMVFQDISVDKLAERIASNSAILANSEIRRLTQMSLIAYKNLARTLMNRVAKTAQVTPDANILLTSLLGELSMIADRAI